MQDAAAGPLCLCACAEPRSGASNTSQLVYARVSSERSGALVLLASIWL